MMGDKMTELLTGIIADDEQLLSLAELCNRCALPAEQVIKMINHGILEPQDQRLSCQRWQFRGDSLLRVRVTQRLRHDLGVNLAGAALALDLLEEVKKLRQKVDALKRA